MITLNFSVDDQLLTRTDENTVAANSHLVHVCEFTFSSEWNGRGKVATFKKRDLMLSVILDDDACTIPPEILQSENKIDVFELSVCGANGNSTITSTVVKVPILAGTWDVMSTEITPTMFEQIMQKIDEIEKGEISPELVLEAVTEYMEAHPLEPIVAEDVAAYFEAHKSEFKGDKGATGPKGDTGNGIASIEKTATSGLVDTYTITFTDGSTSTFEVTNGESYDDTEIRTQVDNLESDIKATADNNVFFASKATRGQRLTISGELTASAAYFTSDYIPVMPSIPYFLNFTLNDMVRVCTYDAQKTFIAYFNNRQNPIVFDSDVAYIRICDIIENIDSDTVIEWKGYTKSVTPEMFGAVGDGIADDTTKLNNAIVYARQHNKILSAVEGKTYAISSQIDFSDLDVDFNNSTIKSLVSIQYMISIDSRTRVNIEKPNTIKNLLIDCNNTSGGIGYVYATHDTIDNVNVLNCNQTAFIIRDGGGTKILNSYILGTASDTSCGIIITTSDCHVQQVIIQDCHNAIINTGTNLYLLVHSWMSKNCSNTVCFTHNSGNAVLVQCHFDTYQKAILRKTDLNLELIGCIYYINTNLWDSEQTPYIIWANDNTFAYSANVHFQNCSFYPLRTQAQLTNIPYNRLVFDNCFFKDGINGDINNVQMNLSRVSADEDYNYVHFRQEGKYIKLDALVTPTSEFTNGYCIIMQIPSSYMFPDEYTFRGLATIGLDALTPSETLTAGLSINPTNGAITINTPTTLDVSRVKFISIDISYKAKKSLDYYRG